MKSRKFEPQFEGGVDPSKLSACDHAESVADPVRLNGDELVDLYQRRLSKSVSLGRSDENAYRIGELNRSGEQAEGDALGRNKPA